MIDFDPLTACRICLEDGAMYPIFESNEDFESMHAKLVDCLKEKIEDIEGFPRHICIKCKNTSETIRSFLNKFEETNKILLSHVVNVKTELLDSFQFSDDDNDEKVFEYELQLENIAKLEPEVDKKDPTELLGSLKHLTVKKIQVENNLDGQNNNCTNIENPKKRKRIQPPKAKKAVERKLKNGSCQKPSKGITKAKNSSMNTKTVTKNSGRLLDQLKEKGPKSGDSPLKLCDLCGNSYKSANNLANHKRTKHSEKKYKCTNCPKLYVTKRQLDDHVSKIHENIRDLICDSCGRAFFSKRILKHHIERIHMNFPKRKKTIYKCEFCDKSFAYKRGVIVHERAAHTGERPSVCSVCGSSFYDHIYLAEHMRLHTGETPHKCPVCGRGYAQRGNMKSHMRNHKISELDADTLSKLKPSFFKFMRP